MKCNEQRATTQQGNHRQEGASAEIAYPTRIGQKAQITQSSSVTEAQKRPKQERSRDEDGAMKKRLEIVLRQKRKHAVR